MHGHFSTAGAYRADPKTEFYRRQDEERRIRDRASRAEFWLMQRFAGKRFSSEDQLRAVATDLAVELYRVVDDELATVIRMACASMWAHPRWHASATAA